MQGGGGWWVGVIIMLRKEALSSWEIQGWRQEVNRVIEDHMLSFQQRAYLHYRPDEPHLDTFFHFSQTEYERLRCALEKLALFTLSLLSSCQAIWEEVDHREGKLVEVRQHLSQATTLVEELRAELDQTRGRLQKAEDLVERGEQERAWLEGVTGRGRMAEGGGRVGKGKTARGGPGHAGSSGLFCQQLKDYIEGLQEENKQLETSLLLLSGKYETKLDQCRLATILVEHLMESLAQRESRQEERGWREGRDCQKEVAEWQFSLSDMVRVLEHTEGSTSPTLNKNYTLIDEGFHPYRYPQSEGKREGEQTGSTFSPHMGVGTDLSYFRRRAAAVQTDWTCINGEEQSQQDDQDYRISIQIIGKRDSPRDQKIAKIIQDLHMQQEIVNKLSPPSPIHTPTPQQTLCNEQSLTVRELHKLNRSLHETYQYYHNKLISSRIKKGHCPHPHPLPPRPRPL